MSEWFPHAQLQAPPPKKRTARNVFLGVLGPFTRNSRRGA